jgi:hypothetical protein
VVKFATMPDPASIDAIRAAVDAIVPPTDGLPGGADLGVERHIVEQAEGAMQGSSDLIAALLNAYAEAVRPAVGFAGLDRAERVQVLRTMSSDESPDIREVADTLQVFTLGGYFSEWTGFDPKTRRLERPQVWDEVVYNGPVSGVPEYRTDV